ncbi:MAG: hypothetical protein DWQ01_10635 [Planctomycetota bacterium]|nr:MAG: hypothetical protein DWQ01_10635 [Planctomycetota bacterium]
MGPTGPQGSQEIVLATNDSSRVLHSYDDGLTWLTLYGDGLENAKAEEVVYYPGPPNPMYVIGAREGVWSYDPATGIVSDFSAGLPVGDRWVVNLAAPTDGDGPLLLVTIQGNAYTWIDSDGSWQLAAQNGPNSWLSAASVSPYSDRNAGPGPAQAMAFASNGVLYLSDDNGASFSAHSQFNTQAQSYYDWAISTVAYADDYESSGVILLGRISLRPNDPKLDRGEIWRSEDFGVTFSLVASTPSGVTTLTATGPGPDGLRHFFAGGNMYPNFAGYFGTGILRSDDGGLTWDDFGNEQDFTLEEGAGKGVSEPPDQKIHQDITPALDYAVSGTLYYGRGEGLFQSPNNGVNWAQRGIRPVEEMRDLGSAIDADGHLIAFGAAYGSGLIRTDVTAGFTELLFWDCPMAYNKTLAVSPNYAADGTVLLGGQSDLTFWFDPAKTPANPYGATGFYLPPLVSTVTGTRVEGYPRVVVFSPNYDGSGATDQTFFWNAWENPPYRSEDGGQTAEPLDKLAGGGTVPTMEYMAVAPTYDPASSATKNDVYGASISKLYRLNDDTWTLVHDFGTKILGLAVDPTFSRPGNPQVFVILHAGPKVAAFIDDPTNPQVIPFGFDLVGLRLQEIKVGNDFGTRPYVYVGAWGEGVLRYDSSDSQAIWEPVGQVSSRPDWWLASFDLSPAFDQDRTVLVGSQYGLVHAQDDPLSPWVATTTEEARDNMDVSFMTFSPNHPMNLQPGNARPWRTISMGGPTGQEMLPLDRNAELALHDGDFFLSHGNARLLEFKTAAGPGTGRITLTATHYLTGAFLGSQSMDLTQVASNLEPFSLSLDLQTIQPVMVRLDVELDPGEYVLFDALVFRR